MGEPSRAPAELRERCRRILSETPIEQEQADVVRPAAGDTRDRSFWARTPRWFAAAAAIALASALVIVALPSRQGAILSAEGMYQAVSWVSQEHDACRDLGRVFERKMTARTESEATRMAVEILDRVPDVLDFPVEGLDELGYEFAGLGACAVPGRGRSVHLVYKSTRADAEPLSLFIQVDEGDRNVEPATSYVAPMGEQESPARGPEVVIWKRDGFLYYLCVPRLPEEGERIRRVFDVPERERPIRRA